MAFFDKMTQPVILKEDSSLDEQLRQLTELLQKSLPADIRKQLEQDICHIKSGITGENNLLFELRNSHMPIFILRDLYIEDGDLSSQIDFIVITRKLIFIIECKNFSGKVEIDSDGNFMQYGKRLYSPITQNERHMQLFRHVRAKSKGWLAKIIFQNYAFKKFYRSVVVLTNPQTILLTKEAPKEIKNKIIHSDLVVEYLKKEIEKSREINSSDAEMLQYAQSFLAMHKNQNKDYTQKYLSKAVEAKPPICPKHGMPMVMREVSSKGKDVGRKLWGCQKYPFCKYKIWVS